MTTEENKTVITKLSTWDMADTVVKWMDMTKQQFD